MTTAPAKPTRRVLIPATARPAEAPRDARPDPADMAATLRDLATRAHRAVRSSDQIDALRELADLHPRIVAFQRRLDADSQRDLASYLAALRREVERRLG